MNIPALFSTPERVKILTHVIYRTTPFGVSQVARELNLSKGLVSMYLNHLTDEGILDKKNGKHAVLDRKNTRAIRTLLNINRIDTDIFKKYDFVEAAGLYGSHAKGRNTEDSDLDIWILSRPTSEESLAKLSSELGKRFGDVTPLFLTPEKTSLLRKENPVFYYSLVFGSMTLHGGGLEET
ncbi:MAG: nucleotidyltransferase domain-containing protein [Candidatus Bathyarchaeota archaeon]|nr:nucleotidyltransferase domain-containing protein [Candidatus Bathyarchaeota archaeon]